MRRRLCSPPTAAETRRRPRPWSGWPLRSAESGRLRWWRPSSTSTNRPFRTLYALCPAGPAPIVVPALLTHAYHGRVDLPLVLDSADVTTRLAPVLGLADPTEAPDSLLVWSLRRRLSELDTPFDGLVLIAAGTTDQAARSTVDVVAAELGRQLNVACVAGYASASSPTAGDAVMAVRATGARRIAVASYFLAPGRLYSAAAASARAAGAAGVAAPLGAAEELVRLIVARATAADTATTPQCWSAPTVSH